MIVQFAYDCIGSGNPGVTRSIVGNVTYWNLA